MANSGNIAHTITKTYDAQEAVLIANNPAATLDDKADLLSDIFHKAMNAEQGIKAGDPYKDLMQAAIVVGEVAQEFDARAGGSKRRIQYPTGSNSIIIGLFNNAMPDIFYQAREEKKEDVIRSMLVTLAWFGQPSESGNSKAVFMRVPDNSQVGFGPPIHTALVVVAGQAKAHTWLLDGNGMLYNAPDQATMMSEILKMQAANNLQTITAQDAAKKIPGLHNMARLRFHMHRIP